MPLLGGKISEDTFTQIKDKYFKNLYQNIGGSREASNQILLQHDLKQIFVQLAYEESFSIDSQGGGPEHNINMIPFMMKMCDSEIEPV